MTDIVVFLLVTGLGGIAVATIYWVATRRDHSGAVKFATETWTRYDFMPQANIKAYELAEILRICQNPNIGPAYQRLPEKLRRHFVLPRRSK